MITRKKVKHLLEKTLRLSYLYDFYHMLLTRRQQEYMQMYYFEDFSLVEIAEVTNVSRQAVYDNLKRTEQVLEDYEEKLSLYKNYKKRLELLSKMEDLTEDEQIRKMIHQLKDIG